MQAFEFLALANLYPARGRLMSAEGKRGPESAAEAAERHAQPLKPRLSLAAPAARAVRRFLKLHQYFKKSHGPGAVRFVTARRRRGFAIAGVQPLPQIWEWSVVAMVAVYYAANVYDSSLAGQLFYAKWLTVLPVIVLSWRAGRRGSAALVALPRLPLVLLGLAALLSMLNSLSVANSGAAFLSLVLALVAAYALAYVIVSSGGAQQFFDAIAIVGRLVITSAAVMWLLGLSLGRGGERFSAWTDNPNTLGMILAPTLVILMANVLSRRHGWLWWSLPFVAVGAFLLMMTGARASIIWVLAAGLGFHAFRFGMGGNLVLGLVGLIVAIGFWDEIIGLIVEVRHEGTADIFSGRLEVWQIGQQLFAERPLLGHGIGMSQPLISQYAWAFIEHQGGHFHNSYLTTAVETGLAGFFALLFALRLAIAGSMRWSNRALKQQVADWPAQALPWAIVIGALSHALFESWLLSAGNANMILFWTCILLLQARTMASPGPLPRPIGSAPKKS